MPWMTTSACCNCGRLFCFNPYLVPSIRLNAQGQYDPNGTRQPVCKTCMELANSRRAANGLEPLEILPGAYEAVDGLPPDETEY